MVDILSSLLPASGSLSRYSLNIWKSPFELDVLNFRGEEQLSEPYSYVIEATSPEPDIDPAQVLRKFACFSMQTSAQPGRTVYGVVRDFQRLSTSADETHYRFELVPRLRLLENTTRTAIYQNQSVPEVVEQLLRAHDLEGQDFEFRLRQAYPERELITQWGENDLQFIRRILAEVGIWWRFETDTRLESETVVFGDGPEQYQFGVTLPYCEPSGMSDGQAESVWGMKVHWQAVTGRISKRDYNYRDATAPLDTAAQVRSLAPVTGEGYHYAQSYREVGDDTDAAAETGAFYARIRHERLLNKQSRIFARTTGLALAPGQVLEPQNYPFSDLKDGILITRIVTKGARSEHFRLNLWGMAYSENVCFRSVPPERPVIRGTVPARVESTEKKDTYAWLDNQGRYRVRLDADRDASGNGYAYLLLRLARPYAGDGYGWHSPLLDGTEVAIAFEAGNPDRPYIAGALHDSDHTDHVTERNHTRNVLRTPSNNKLRMEDRRGEEHVKLATEYGKTQLNAGHLVDAQNKQRGQGVELRTDEHGAVRGGKGIFISADAQPKAQGQVMDNSAALREIECLQQQVKALSQAAAEVSALEADIAAQIAMFSGRLKPINQVVLASAPEGMALTSGEHLQLAATKNLILNAGQNADFGVIKNLTLNTGQEMGMFALKGEMSLKASQGKVEVQAQNNTMALAAGRKVSITAVDGDILFAAKKRITLIGGGSYLILQDGKIEYGTEHDYFCRTGHSVLTVPEAKPLKMPNMPFVEGYSEYFILQDQKTGEPLAGLPYTLSIDGREFEGVTDKNGYTQYAHTPESKNIEVNPHPELFNRMILNASYWDDATPLKLDFDKPTEE
ncbi:type VI secretion system tip protein VgrG [Rahnella sp. AA]|uniref:type VI secretion system Vgr family protein n=1 Tax=Rahnella sp. AA TaxID=2057180 RepID=UPI000C341C18|nr:type VI secretion system Vgr family protein [Rahnella sp. AA]PKE28528.1 type VI secretion system tip protein VgrG [Rahnella sp. AA]